MKRNPMTVTVGVVLILIFLLLLFVFQVRQSEVVVVTTFGKPTRDIVEPGAYFKWPWPIQKVYKFDQRIQVFEDKFEEQLTRDGNNLLTMVYVGWRIKEPQAFFPKFRGGSVVEAERMLESILRSAKNSVVGRHDLADFVNADESRLKFDAIETEIKTLAEAALQTTGAGLHIEFLGLRKLGLPENVTQAVFERMTSERNKLASRTEAEGKAEADKIRSAADSEAAKLLADANAQAIRIRSEGEKIAAEVLPVFEQNPALANFDLRLKALEQSLRERSTLIFDARTPPFDLFNLVQGLTTNRVTR